MSNKHSIVSKHNGIKISVAYLKVTRDNFSNNVTKILKKYIHILHMYSLEQNTYYLQTIFFQTKLVCISTTLECGLFSHSLAPNKASSTLKWFRMVTA